ncbi:MAG TPA: ABC transporter permease [Bryobacteraceae bacterium]|jgi:putative ABC transport system permease protein|nr:ABC transporter permease [Bryobacteraceae bacterium]
MRFAFRLLRRDPGFTLTVILTLGLAIAVNSAVFSVLNAILLRGLPYTDARRIVALWQTNPARGLSQQLVSVPDYFDWKENSRVFEAMAAWNFQYFNLTGSDEPERIEGLKVTAGFFPILGVNAAVGRTFLPEDERPGSDRVAILSHSLWQRRFGGDPGVVGRTVLVEGQPYVVVGVLPGHFRLFRVLNRDLDLYVPYALDRASASRADHLLFVYARLKAGTSIGQAQAALATITDGVARQYLDTSKGWAAEAIDLQSQWTRQIRPILLISQVAVGFVLLIACANITSLMLARTVGREREMAIRVALGAGRLRLVRQLLAESGVLGGLSGAVGTAMAWLLVESLNQLPYTAVNRVEPFRLDASVLAFSLGIAALSGIAVGLAPAIQLSLRNLKPDMLRGRRLSRLLIFAEVALAVVLLAGAGLLARSSLEVSGMRRGLDLHNVLTAQVWLPPARYANAGQIARFWRQAVERTAALPGVQSATAVNFPPLSALWTSVGIHLDGATVPRPGEEPQVQYWIAGPNYFLTAGIPLLEGRPFAEQDDYAAHGVVVVSAAMARRFWPGRSAVGKRIRPVFPESQAYWLPKPASGWLTVVGVAGDVRLDGVVQTPLPQIYLPYGQNPSSILHLMVRTSADPLRWAPSVRREIQMLDKDQPVFDVKSLEDVLGSSVTRASVVTRMLGVFAALAMGLAGLGIYGVVANFVSKRTREIGVRMALGAGPPQVIRLVVRQEMRGVVAGVAAGICGALAGAGALKSLLVGVTTTDLPTFVAVTAVFLTVALAAAYVPARRAARMDPMAALREE